MAAPTISNMTFDKPVYESGETVTLTVSYSPDTYTPISVTVNATGTVAQQTATSQDQFNDAKGSAIRDINPSGPTYLPSDTDTVTWQVLDDAGDSWTQVSDNGSTE